MITNSELTEILSLSPYKGEDAMDRSHLCDKLGSPQKVTRVRKRHLDAKDATASPFKTKRTEEYGNGPLSKKMIEYKKAHNATTGRNGSIAIYTSPDSKKKRYTIAVTEGPPTHKHAELKALDLLPPHVKEVDLLYTERAPCKKGSNCHRKLKAVLGETCEVVHSVDYPTDTPKRKKTEKVFRTTQAHLGIRDSKR